jgi:hypothetical protein
VTVWLEVSATELVNLTNLDPPNVEILVVLHEVDKPKGLIIPAISHNPCSCAN